MSEEAGGGNLNQLNHNNWLFWLGLKRAAEVSLARRNHLQKRVDTSWDPASRWANLGKWQLTIFPLPSQRSKASLRGRKHGSAVSVYSFDCPTESRFLLKIHFCNHFRLKWRTFLCPWLAKCQQKWHKISSLVIGLTMKFHRKKKWGNSFRTGRLVSSP